MRHCSVHVQVDREEVASLHHRRYLLVNQIESRDDQFASRRSGQTSTRPVNLALLQKEHLSLDRDLDLDLDLDHFDLGHFGFDLDLDHLDLGHLHFDLDPEHLDLDLDLEM